MQRILFIGVPYLLESIYFNVSNRSFLKESFVCKLLPATFINILRIICSSLFARKSSKRMFFHAFLLSIFFETGTLIKTFHSVKITGIYHTIAFNSKIIFIAILASNMLKRRFDFLQKVGVFVIFCGICWSGFNTNAKMDSFTINTAFSFIAIVISAFMSALGNVYFEKYVRANITDFHTYNIQYCFMNLIVSLFLASVEIYRSKAENIIPTFTNIKFYNYIIISNVHMSLTTYIFTLIEPVIRNFMFTVINTIIGIMIDYVEKHEINSNSLITLGIVNIGILFYEVKNIKRLARRIMKKNEEPDKIEA